MSSNYSNFQDQLSSRPITDEYQQTILNQAQSNFDGLFLLVTGTSLNNIIEEKRLLLIKQVWDLYNDFVEEFVRLYRKKYPEASKEQVTEAANLQFAQIAGGVENQNTN